MTEHILQLNQSEPHGGLWCSCSCGWRSEVVPVGPEDESTVIVAALAAKGIAHRDSVEVPS